MTTPPDPHEEMPATLDTVRRSMAVVGLCGGGLALAAWWGFGPRAAWSAGLGSAVAVANLYVLARVVVALLDRSVEQGNGAAMSWGLIGLFKMAALFGGGWWLFRSGVVEAVPFVVGYGALPLGIPLAQILPHPRPASGAGAP